MKPILLLLMPWTFSNLIPSLSDICDIKRTQDALRNDFLNFDLPYLLFCLHYDFTTWNLNEPMDEETIFYAFSYDRHPDIFPIVA